MSLEGHGSTELRTCRLGLTVKVEAKGKTRFRDERVSFRRRRIDVGARVYGRYLSASFVRERVVLDIFVSTIPLS